MEGANRQFDWIEISLVHDKSDKHLTLYNSYNVECAAKMIKSLEFANISERYSATNTLKYDTTNNLQKHLLWKQFLAWHTDGCSNAPITDFKNNPVAQKLLDEEDYFSDSSDERLYVGLRQSRGCTNELEKPTRNDSKMTITIETKSSLAKKHGAESLGVHKR